MIGTPSGSTRIGSVLLEVGDAADAVRGHAFTAASSVSIAAEQLGFEDRDAQALHDVGEEAEHDESPCLLLADAAGLQVEELLVVEAAGRARVACALDVARLDLEVRDRVGACTLGEHQVAVRFVGVRAGRIRSDENVADPDAVRARTLQRALVEHVAGGVRALVVQEDLALEVLPGVGVGESVEVAL